MGQESQLLREKFLLLVVTGRQLFVGWGSGSSSVSLDVIPVMAVNRTDDPAMLVIMKRFFRVGVFQNAQVFIRICIQDLVVIRVLECSEQKAQSTSPAS